MSLIMAGDESWVYGYGSETRHISSPQPKRHDKSSPMLTPCWLCYSAVMGWFSMKSSQEDRVSLQNLQNSPPMPPRRSVHWEVASRKLNCASQQCLSTQVSHKKRNFDETKHFIAPTTSIFTDLTRCNVFLFSQLEGPMKGRRLDEIEEIQANATRPMRAFRKCDHQKCFL